MARLLTLSLVWIVSSERGQNGNRQRYGQMHLLIDYCSLNLNENLQIGEPPDYEVIRSEPCRARY